MSRLSRLSRLAMTAAVCLAVGTAVAEKVKVDHLGTHDFSRDETVAWMPGTPAHTASIQERVERELRRRLESAGLTFVDRGKPDLYVQAHAITDLETRARAVNAGLGIKQQGRWGSVGSGSNVSRTKTFPVGTLIVELLDADTGQVVWQAIARSAVKGEATDVEKRLAKALDRAFEGFPPPTR